MEEKPAKPLSKLYDILADIKEEIIVPLAKTSGIHKIEESTISSIKTKNNFKSADFDTFKTINLSLLPKPKFKLLGKADRRALGMESTSSAQATNGKQEEDEQDDRGERMHDITTVKQVKDRQTTGLLLQSLTACTAILLAPKVCNYSSSSTVSSLTF